MARYRIRLEPTAMSIELTEVTGHREELLRAFQECQEGRCACPTDEYRKVASMWIQPEEAGIAICLEAERGVRFDPSQISACLDSVVDRVEGNRWRPGATSTQSPMPGQSSRTWGDPAP